MSRGSTVAAWVLLSVVCNGLTFGVADHAIHLPFTAMSAEPSRWSGDLLSGAVVHHPSILWQLLAVLSRPFGLPGAAVGLHLVGLAVTGWLLHLFVEEVWESPAAPVIALLFAAPAHGALAGPATLEPLLLPRGVALPVELWALLLFVRGRREAAFFVAGLAALLHAPSAVATAAGLLGAALLLEGLSGRAFKSAAWAGLGASPIVVRWATAGVGGSLTRVDDAWWQLLMVRLPHHLAPSSWPLSAWLGVGAWLLVGVLASRVGRAEPHAALLGFGAGVLAWAVVAGSFVGPHLRVALALQLEPWQGTRLLVLLASAGAGAAAAGLPFVRPRRVAAYAPLLLVVAAGAALTLGVPGHERRPSWSLRGEPGEELQIARWLGANTPAESLVSVPPDRFSTARVRAGRPVLVTWKDGGEALFDRALAMEWRRRLELSCGCTPWTGPPGIGPLRARLRAALRTTDASALTAAARDEGVDFLVLWRETPGLRPGEAVFATDSYEVFELR